MLLRLLTLSLALAASIVAFKPIPCSCDATPAVNGTETQKCRDAKWCGVECLRYLREDERIMDLVHCRESTCDVVVEGGEVEGDEVEEREGGEVKVKAGKTCTCHCKNARQVSWEKGQVGEVVGDEGLEEDVVG